MEMLCKFTPDSGHSLHGEFTIYYIFLFPAMVIVYKASSISYCDFTSSQRNFLLEYDYEHIRGIQINVVQQKERL